MNKSLKVLLSVCAFVVVVLIVVSLSKSTKVGSVAVGNEYHATTTYSKTGVPTFNRSQVLIGNTQGTLGSVVITGAVAGVLRLQDATSSTDVSSTTITTFPASTAVGTYVFDSIVTRGLIVETTADLIPTTTITFRSN
jgi:hypothetical protein